METAEARRAVRAAVSTVSALDLRVDDAAVLSDSNRLVVRLTPCDVVARVAPMAYQASAEMEVELARRLAETGSPLAVLEPRVEPRVYVRDAFVIDLWAHYETAPWEMLSPVAYAHALKDLHDGMRRLDVGAPHFMDRVIDTRGWVARRSVTPDLSDADRELLTTTLGDVRRSMDGRQVDEHLLHGEPHPCNVLNTAKGPLFTDFENCVRGPAEYDLAWMPREVSDHYPGADQELLSECRRAVLAMIAAHRWRRDDHHPSGRQSGVEFLNALRRGPPWVTLDVV